MKMLKFLVIIFLFTSTLYPLSIVDLQKEIPHYVNRLKEIITDINDGKATLNEMIDGASLASTLVQVIKDKNYKMRIAAMGLKIANMIIKKAPNRVEGYYFSALHLGYYSLYKGAQYSLYYIPKIEKWTQKAIKLNQSFKKGAPLIFACALYFEAPGFPVSIGDIYKAKELCEKAIKQYPENCTAYLYLSAIYDVLGNPQKAKTILLKGKHNCKPVNNSLEENVFYQEDLKSINTMLKQIQEGKSIKDFMKNR